jgi:hypothetical protein
MAAGFSEKMKAFKKYRPFLNPLKEKGIIDNPDKFNLMLSALDGDKEAIKTLIKEHNIDPMELDVDNVNYKPQNHVASELELALDDILDNAKQFGIDDKVQKVIANEWDDKSVVELLQDPQSQADLIEHMSSGIYDIVQERIMQKRIADPYGTFSSLPAIDQYRAAANELEAEYLQWVQQQQAQQQAQVQPMPSAPQQPQVQGQNQQQVEQYAQAQAQNQQQKRNEEERRKVDEERKRAASVSRKKPRSRPKQKQEFDPMALSDDEFEDLLNSFIQ